ncbi:Intron maturase [Abeliophyllum distichum]|uniref:Intron maturase n=1 Tax=Abeliophyllum distichum TaxID=126358 RepID=A0ABD1UIH9_9LAMI
MRTKLKHVTLNQRATIRFLSHLSHRHNLPSSAASAASSATTSITRPRTCANVTGSFPHKNSIYVNTLSDLLSLKNAVVHNHFQWNSKTQQFIRSPNDKPIKFLSKRKLNSVLASKTPPFQDLVVQEVLLMILEPVFEPQFSSKSHAFRPGRNPHTVIRTIRSNFAGYLWFIRGDISEILDKVDVNVVVGCVEKAVKDKKVLNLIKSGLKGPPRNCTYREDSGEKVCKRKKKKGQTRKRLLNENEPKPDPYWLRSFFDFAPEEAAKIPNYGYCGILSPLLANVCLNELDHMMEDQIIKFFKPL